MPKTTRIIEVTQGITGPVIDRFTIDIDDDLDSDEQTRIIKEEMNRRIKKGETNGRNS